MAELVIANLPQDIEQRLRRRAQLHGRSLENEALALLAAASDIGVVGSSNEPFGAAVNRRVREMGMSDEAWNELDRSLEAARLSRNDSIHRWIDFEGPEWAHLDTDR